MQFSLCGNPQPRHCRHDAGGVIWPLLTMHTTKQSQPPTIVTRPEACCQHGSKRAFCLSCLACHAVGCNQRLICDGIWSRDLHRIDVVRKCKQRQNEQEMVDKIHKQRKCDQNTGLIALLEACQGQVSTHKTSASCWQAASTTTRTGCDANKQSPIASEKLHMQNVNSKLADPPEQRAPQQHPAAQPCPPHSWQC